MDPSQQPAAPIAGPAAPAAPPISSAPVLPPVAGPVPVVTPVASTTQYGAYSSQPKGTSAKKIILAIVGVVVVSLLALGAILIPPTMRAIQAKATNIQFMTAMTAGDINIAMAVTDGEDETKQFLEAAMPSLKGKYTEIESKEEKGVRYTLFSLTNEKGKKARTHLEFKGGRWIVTGLFYGSDTLAVMPSSTDKVPDAAADNQAPNAEAPKTAASCLADEDISKVFSYATGFTNYEQTERKWSLDPHFFKPDSTVYNYPDISAKLNNKLKDLYTANSSKSFSYRLAGKVQESSTTASGVKLSNDRSQKVKSDLVALGVPADRIVVAEPSKSTATYQDGSERNVDVMAFIALPCSEAAATSNGR